MKALKVALRAALVIAVAAAAVFVSAGSAAAATIESNGPLTSIGVSEDLNCSVRHVGDEAGEFFGETACGTFVTVGASHYGPANVPAGNEGNPPYTPVTQSPVTGSGTSSDPFTIVTVVDLGTSGLRLTETDSYVVGQESYLTSVTIQNNSGASVEAILYRAGDCFLQNSDTGFGSVEPRTGAVSCVNAVTSESGESVPGTRIEQWFPISAGSSYFENFYFSVWEATVSGMAFPDSCACTENIDNGGGLSWNVAIPAGGSVTRSQLTNFSPLGRVPLSVTTTADSTTASPGGTDGYSITVSNPNTSAVSLTSITDTLPNGFSYVHGSTTGAASTDPAINGQTLTWSGPITVPAGSPGAPGTATLHFNVDVGGSSGTFVNNAGATSSEFSIVPSVESAAVTITPPPPPPPPPPGKTEVLPQPPTVVLPAPVLGKTVNVKVVSGVVFVKLPAGAHLSAVSPFDSAFESLSKGSGFIPLTEARQIPVGSTLDTTGGVVELATATAAAGKPQIGDFGAGIFTILQNRSQRGLTNLNIVNNTANTHQVCTTVGKKASAAAKRLSSKVLGRLNGNAHGKYTTRGQYSAATVRGTIWSVVNRCDGTLTQVSRGVVSVRDFVRRKTITLHAGQHYLAKAP